MGAWPQPNPKRGNILPFDAQLRPPKTNFGSILILLACNILTASTQGYDGALIGGLNIIPQYSEYFQLSNNSRYLNTATFYAGGAFACFFWGWLTDAYGRRVALFWAAATTVIAAVIQGAAQNNAMFTLARILLGFGTTASAITGPAYLAETLPWNHRALSLAFFDDFFYIGALIAAGVTYGAFQLSGDWAWRLPSLVQGIWGLACIVLLPWMPESPRWLVDQGRAPDALLVMARINANGDTRDDLVRLQLCQIVDTISYERNPWTWGQILRNRGARKRLIISSTCALFSMLMGNIITSYHIGKMLRQAGVPDSSTQLLINVGLNGTTLVVSILGSYYTHRMGAKAAALVSTAGASISMYILGALTEYYGDSDYRPGVYATVAIIFFFSASYGFGWIPVLFLIPAEMLNFSIRAYGMSLFSFVICVTGMWGNFAFPIALDTIGWRLYLINASWNLVFFAFIACYWVEIRGKTLEEIDALFDGRKHSDMPDIANVLNGVDPTWKKKVATWMKLRLPATQPGAPAESLVHT